MNEYENIKLNKITKVINTIYFLGDFKDLRISPFL